MSWLASTAKKEKAPATFEGAFSPSKDLKRTWSEIDRRDATAASRGEDGYERRMQGARCRLGSETTGMVDAIVVTARKYYAYTNNSLR
jgi:hypothetical protein